jgi:hypothetical protein
MTIDESASRTALNWSTTSTFGGFFGSDVVGELELG